MQRHNELFAVVKRAPSDIREIMVRRLKDFTKEFFERVFTIAQSYHDNPDEKNGEQYPFCSLLFFAALAPSVPFVLEIIIGWLHDCCNMCF